SFSANGQSNAIGLICAANTAVISSDFSGFLYGICAYSLALGVFACRFEVNSVGIVLGILPDGTGRGMGAVDISASTFESNDTHIYFAGGTGGVSVRGGSWQSSHPSNAYGIRCGANLHHAEFVGINIGGALTTAGIQIDNYAAGGAPSEVVFQGCSVNHIAADPP